MIRQIAQMSQRLGPQAARAESDGPRIGECLKSLLPEITHTRNGLVFYLFASKDCPVCSYIKNQDLGKVMDYWNKDAELVTYFDEDERMIPESLKVGSYIHRYEARDLRNALGINYVPFCFVTNRENKVLSKGLVNNLSHFESLLEAAMQAQPNYEK